MLFIQGKEICFKYEEATENLLENLNFHITPSSKIGLTGKNGCGKTTLFKLISGGLSINDGTLYIKDKLRTGYLAQEIPMNQSSTLEEYLWSDNKLFELKKIIKEFEYGKVLLNETILIEALADYDSGEGYLFEAELEKIITKFGFIEKDLSRPINSFSGGEKTRIAIAKLLLQKPDLLLLDEPTNHLDLEQISWLENYLSEIALPFIIISHDRTFLDQVVNTIWEIDQKNLEEYSGNYTFYKKQKEEKLERQKIQYEIQKKKIKQLEIASRDLRNKSDKFENFKAARSVKKNGGICQRDVGSGHNLRVKSVMKKALSVESRLEKMLENEKAKKPFIEKKRQILLNSIEIKNKWVLEAYKLETWFAENTVFKDLSFSVLNNTKLAIIGKNGSGKTTLLKILAGISETFSGTLKWAPQVKIGYYAQEHENLDFSNTIIAEVSQNELKNQGFARTILGSFNISGDKIFKKISTLSIGERSKVSLAKIICSDTNLLILDEPTNSLEISAKEAFEEALANYNGTVIFVSHDRYFLNKIATEVYQMDNGNKRSY
jgi:ATP-binding cassette subfamily F protein 3